MAAMIYYRDNLYYYNKKQMTSGLAFILQRRFAISQIFCRQNLESEKLSEKLLL